MVCSSVGVAEFRGDVLALGVGVQYEAVPLVQMLQQPAPVAADARPRDVRRLQMVAVHGGDAPQAGVPDANDRVVQVPPGQVVQVLAEFGREHRSLFVRQQLLEGMPVELGRIREAEGIGVVVRHAVE